MIFYRIVLFVTLLLIVISVDPSRAAQVFPPLDQCFDQDLQVGLETSLNSLHLDTAVQQKRLSVTLVDVTDPQEPRLAEVNGNYMMYAASLPKIAILLGAFERIAQGDLEWNPAIEETLIRMIRNSSNTAATEMLNQVGKEYLADLLQSPRYRLYDPQKNGGLWVGKEYSKNPAWRRDPLHHLSHGATALQVARFYYLLDTGRLVSPESSREMKEILGQPAIHHKFVKGLEQNRPGAIVFRKSGTWKEFHSDSALVEHRGRRYIAVALAKSPQGGEWLSRLITALDDLIVRSPSRLLRLAGNREALQ